MKIQSFALFFTTFITAELFSQNDNWYGWGNSSSGVFGNGTIGISGSLATPTKMSHLDSFKEIFPGLFHVYALDKKNELWSWGNNGLKGQLGINSDKSYFETPQKVETNNTWKTIATQDQFSAGIKSDGTLWVWGRYHAYPSNYGGSNGVDEIFPVLIDTSKNWKDVKVGFAHILVLRNDNTLWSLGVNTNGALGIAGDGGFMPSKAITPQLVMKDIDYFEAYGSSSFAIDKKGYLYLWGQSKGLKITDGSKDYLLDSIYYTIPHLVSNDSNWKCVSIKGSHAIALKKDGTLWSWGENNFGQLGIGNYNNTFIPTKVGSAMNWKNISASNSNSFAIKDDGTLWSWGRGGYLVGQEFNFNDLNSPIQIGKDSTWLRISAGSLFVMAQKKLTVTLSNEVHKQVIYSVYPNPSKNNINIKIVDEQFIGSINIQIFDLDGRRIFQSSINSEREASIPLKDVLGPGMYFLQIVIDNHFSPVQKIILN